VSFNKIRALNPVHSVVLQVLSMAKYFIYASNTSISVFHGITGKKYLLYYSERYGYETDLHKELSL